ncbi:MAG: biotin/lipoate A/B protein ligase family protein [Candidatus Hodarchaeota archaeon]
MDKWRLIDLDTYDGYTNMAIDEAILNARIENKVPNTLRFYRWFPSTCSIGKNQSISNEVDLNACKELGFKIVRRISGGGAVFHDYNGEITYSIIANQTDLIPRNIDESFRKLCQGIIIALSKIGLKAYHGKSHCPSIFVNNRKISGNAQTRRKNVILQHGTILLDYDPELMYTVLLVREGHKREKVISSVFQKVTTIKEEIKKSIKINQIKEFLIEGYKEVFGDNFQRGILTDYELEMAKKLRNEKYLTDEWNFKIT